MRDAESKSKRFEALALRHDRDPSAECGRAPQVVAKGAERVAERILELAREHGVPVREDRDLVAMLSTCDVEDEIPPEAYAAVAEFLAWLYRCNRELGERAG
jgi:flagellar biosynthesis protein